LPFLHSMLCIQPHYSSLFILLIAVDYRSITDWTCSTSTWEDLTRKAFTIAIL